MLFSKYIRYMTKNEQVHECSVKGMLKCLVMRMSLLFDLLFCNIYQSFSVMHIPSATIKIPPALRNPVMNE